MLRKLFHEIVKKYNTNVVLPNFFNSVWEVIGGKYGLTCNRTGNSSSDLDQLLFCKNLKIPNCVDRNVYCTYPPDPYPEGSVTVKENPSLVYKKMPGTKILQIYIKVIDKHGGGGGEGGKLQQNVT